MGRKHHVPYVPGEILIKYKAQQRDAARQQHHDTMGFDTISNFNNIAVTHIKLPDGLSVEQAMAMLASDPTVEYVEPNYIYHASDIFPNDADFNELWGLHNTGQTVNGTAGTVDADIDAPAAWDLQTGSGNQVVVAVIDSGVACTHTDLAANIWNNPGEIPGNLIDDDGNGYVDDVVGWDFHDNDNDPSDADEHGTHVAGTIAAVGNNANGTTGVTWQAKIMCLRGLDAFGSGTTANLLAAMNYANRMGARVINNSWGGSDYSQAMKDAIDASQAIVVCAAGNAGVNNDVTPEYPASYTSNNIVSVAASTQLDTLVSWSNYGVASVDLAAPGTNIYSTKPDRQTVFTQNFDGGVFPAGWTTGGTSNWDVTNAKAQSGAWSLTDSPGGNYANNADNWARTPAINLTGHTATVLSFWATGWSEEAQDNLYVEVSTDGSNWTVLPVLVYIAGESQTGTYISGDLTSSWFNFFVDLGKYDDQATVYIRWHFTANGSTTGDGFYIDDIEVTTDSANSSQYQFLSGTSMATPHVSGIAALLLADDPTLTRTQLVSSIINRVDVLSSLSGRVATSGRANAYMALTGGRPVVSQAWAVPSGDNLQLHAVVNPNKQATTVYFEYGTSGQFNEYTTQVNLGNGIDPVTVVALTGNLHRGVDYVFRAVAVNSVGKTVGEADSYKTEHFSIMDTFGGGGGCFIQAIQGL